jgi:hypothetical protein
MAKETDILVELRKIALYQKALVLSSPDTLLSILKASGMSPSVDILAQSTNYSFATIGESYSWTYTVPIGRVGLLTSLGYAVSARGNLSCIVSSDNAPIFADGAHLALDHEYKANFYVPIRNSLRGTWMLTTLTATSLEVWAIGYLLPTELWQRLIKVFNELTVELGLLPAEWLESKV